MKKKTYDIFLEGVSLSWKGAIFLGSYRQAKSPSLEYRLCFLAWMTFPGMMTWHKEKKNHEPYWQSIWGHCAGPDARTGSLCVGLERPPAHRLSGRTGTLYGFKCSLIECGKSSSQPSSEQSFYCAEARRWGGGRGTGLPHNSARLCFLVDVRLKSQGGHLRGQRKIPVRLYILVQV